MIVRGQWANLARMPGLHPYSFSKDILGFLMTTESQDIGLTSHPKDSAFYSIVSLSLYWGVRTIDCKKPGCSVRDVTRRFLKSIFEAQSGRRQPSPSSLRVTPG